MIRNMEAAAGLTLGTSVGEEQVDFAQSFQLLAIFLAVGQNTETFSEVLKQYPTTSSTCQSVLLEGDHVRDEVGDHADDVGDVADDGGDLGVGGPHFFPEVFGKFDEVQVVEQLTAPKMIVLDTMNFWMDVALERLKHAIRIFHSIIIHHWRISICQHGIGNSQSHQTKPTQ